jgi:hypothetical protein
MSKGITGSAVAPVLYSTGKVYNPNPTTAQGNAETWALVAAHLAANGPSTLLALQAVVAPRNHAPFVKYAVKRGWLAPAKK